MRKQLGVIAITLLCGAGAASAQIKPAAQPQAPTTTRNLRQGFWIGFGLGDGSAGVDCVDCSTSRTDGLSGYLKLGGTLNQHLLLGGEMNGWAHSEGGVDESLGFATATLTWYPSATGAFFLKFGLGAMSYTATDASNNKLEATAGAGQFGLGYDWRVHRNLSITPFLNSLATSAASFTFNGQSAPSGEDIKLNLVQIGIGLTWH